MKIDVDGQVVWRAGNSLIITLPNAKDLGVCVGDQVKGRIEIIKVT